MINYTSNNTSMNQFVVTVTALISKVDDYERLNTSLLPWPRLLSELLSCQGPLRSRILQRIWCQWSGDASRSTPQPPNPPHIKRSFLSICPSMYPSKKPSLSASCLTIYSTHLFGVNCGPKASKIVSEWENRWFCVAPNPCAFWKSQTNIYPLLGIFRSDMLHILIHRSHS